MAGLVFALLGVIAWLVWDASLAYFFRKARGESPTRSSIPSVTVVCCVRNGEQHLPAWLECAKHWHVPVIVVDDGSTDATPSILNSANHVQRVRVENSLPGKKDAVLAGLQKATTDWVLLTDVDCRPDASWVDEMMSGVSPQAEVIAGLSFPVLGEPSALQLTEAVAVARRYVAALGAGWPYMAVGRNMAYKKSAFPGFDRHRHLASGDDDLLIQDWPRRRGVRRADQVRFLCHQVPTHAASTRSTWRQMKRRHLSAGTAYAPPVVAALSFPTLATFSWAFGAALVAWDNISESPSVLHIGLWIVGGGGAFAWLVHVLTFRSFAKQCGLKGLSVWGGLLQPLAFLEQAVATARVAWAFRFGQRKSTLPW